MLLPCLANGQESDNSCFLLHFLCIHFLLSHIASVCFMIVYLDKTPHLSSTTYLFLCPTALLMLGPVMFMGAIRDTYVCRSIWPYRAENPVQLGLHGGKSSHGGPEGPHLGLTWFWRASVRGSPNPVLSAGSLQGGDLGQSPLLSGPQFPLFHYLVTLTLQSPKKTGPRSSCSSPHFALAVG